MNLHELTFPSFHLKSYLICNYFVINVVSIKCMNILVRARLLQNDKTSTPRVMAVIHERLEN